MTLKDIYHVELKKKTPGMAFIDKIAELTKKHPITVRRWIGNENPIYPDALTQQILADHFKTTPEELFPPKK